MAKKVVLSIAAHGDDAEFFAGGTLAKMADDGHDVYLVIATHNDRGSFRLSPGELRACAQPEAEASAAALGAQGVFMLGYVDGDLGDEKQSVLRGKIMRLIRELRADIIFCWDPFAPFEDHPDHRAVAWAASDAATFAHFPLYHPEHLTDGLKPYRVTERYWYSKAGWQTNRLVDISDYMDKKLAALYGYHCQMVLTVDDFVQAARATGVDESKLATIDALKFKPYIQTAMHARNGALGAQMGTVYAEAFRYEREEAPNFLHGTAE
ncbi:MAG: PIG-L family deacetylase [Anaerolineae bacterium]|nr:PIG-L family deacetylase [Anaerolineae bacterium]